MRILQSVAVTKSYVSGPILAINFLKTNETTIKTVLEKPWTSMASRTGPFLSFDLQLQILDASL